MKLILKHPSNTFEELVLLISPSVFLDFRFVRLGLSLGFSRSLSVTTVCKLFTHTLPLKRILSEATWNVTVVKYFPTEPRVHL